jgi:hypothetical protein
MRDFPLLGECYVRIGIVGGINSVLMFASLRDARSEDAVMLAFQIWLLGLSIVAILNESIPHLCVSIFV